MPICGRCHSEMGKAFRCPYCFRAFCENCFYEHMAWERKHEHIAEGSEIWRLRKRRVI